MGFTFVLFVWVSISSQVLSCDIQSIWRVDGYRLDLSIFQQIGLIINGTDIQYSYSFSPANNLLDPSYLTNKGTNTLMQFYPNGTSTTLSYYLRSTGLIPTISFSNNNTIIWTFQYIDTTSTAITVQYICDPTLSTKYPYMKFTNIIEVVPAKWLFEISSAYFCPNNTNTSKELNQNYLKNRCNWQVRAEDDELYT